MAILCFGEILWDCFPDKQAIGGALLNLSAHLAAQGEASYLLSAVGADSLGTAAREQVRAFGVSDCFLLESSLSTGVCSILIDAQGTPHYDLRCPAAYDDIALTAPLLRQIQSTAPRALCFGTLALRRAPNRESLTRLTQAIDFPERFCDMNIRRPYISRPVLESVLDLATIVKFSREEADIFAELGLLAAPGSLESLCRSLARQWPGLRLCLVTLDEDGAFLYDCRQDSFCYSRRPQGTLVSAVGAGDSFSAAFLHSHLAGNAPADCLEAGIALSEYVITQQEAVPPPRKHPKT